MPFVAPLDDDRSLRHSETTLTSTVALLAEDQVRFIGFDLGASASQIRGVHVQRYVAASNPRVWILFVYKIDVQCEAYPRCPRHATTALRTIALLVPVRYSSKYSVISFAVFVQIQSLRARPTLSTLIGSSIVSTLVVFVLVFSALLAGCALRLHDPRYFDARSNVRSALLVSSGTSVTSSTGYTVLTGTLTGVLVTGLSRSSDRVAVARFAGLAMRDRSRRIPVVTFSAIMTVPSCRKMPALQANASADTARQLVKFHVESALSRVEVAVALFALVGVPRSGPGPGSVEVERPTPLAISTGGVVLALADDLAVLAGDAPCRVAVALAPAAHGKVRDGVVMREGPGTDDVRATEITGDRGGRGRADGAGAPCHGDEAHVLGDVERVVRLHFARRDHLMGMDRG